MWVCPRFFLPIGGDCFKSNTLWPGAPKMKFLLTADMNPELRGDTQEIKLQYLIKKSLFPYPLLGWATVPAKWSLSCLENFSLYGLMSHWFTPGIFFKCIKAFKHNSRNSVSSPPQKKNRFKIIGYIQDLPNNASQKFILLNSVSVPCLSWQYHSFRHILGIDLMYLFNSDANSNTFWK